MTTLNSMLNIAAQGMFTAQTGLGVTSDNIANVNTAGYVRKVVNQDATFINGIGTGISVDGVTRATNQFLQNASLSAGADAGSASVVSDLIGQAQALFGDPSSSTSYLNQFGQVLSDMTAVANDPASNINNIQAVSDLGQFLSQSRSVSTQINQLTGQADSRVGVDVTQVNQILGQISTLNGQITRATTSGGDATTAQNTQSMLINQLSSLLDVKVSQTPTGGVSLSTSSGAQLVSSFGAATLNYQAGSGQVTISQPAVNSTAQPLTLSSGEISGLLSLRNVQLPAVGAQLSTYVSGAVSALNKASNAASSVPAPATLTGDNTGYGSDLATAVSGFTGKTNVAIVSPTGQLQQQITIDFDAGTMTDSSGAVTGFTPSSFATSLTSALGGAGTATFSNGALSISATGGNGVAIADDSTTPSSKVGEGFSQYFGLNNLVSSSTITNYHTGLQAGSANGFVSDNSNPAQISLQLTTASGSALTTANVQIPSGGSIQSVLDALNAPVGGLGLYGQFSLDSTGYLSFTPTAQTALGASVSVTGDNTQWGTGGASITQLFGVGASQQASRTGSYQVRSDIAAAPANLQTATLNLSAAPSNPVLALGDGSGALAISKAGTTTTSFDAAGSLAAMSTTVAQYAAVLGGALGNQASSASEASTAAAAVQTEADTRRSSVEGVSLDQELVNLTTYQQAYSASARLVTANQDMFTALINMVP